MSDEQLFKHLKKVGIKSMKIISSKEALVLDKTGKGYSLLESFFKKYKVHYNSNTGNYKVKKIGMLG